jgi:hypothetical protein
MSSVKFSQRTVPGTIHQKLGGAGDVVLFGASGFVQQVAAANHLGIWVGKKGESVALLLPQMFRDVGWVYADGHGPDTLCGKLGKIFLNASQLEVAEGSPISTIENEKQGFGLSRSRRGGKQLGKRDRLAGAVGQSEVRYALAYLWSAGGARHVPNVNEEPYGAGKE